MDTARVKLLVQHGLHNAGEMVGFVRTEAARLVAAGKAEWHPEDHPDVAATLTAAKDEIVTATLEEWQFIHANARSLTDVLTYLRHAAETRVEGAVLLSEEEFRDHMRLSVGDKRPEPAGSETQAPGATGAADGATGSTGATGDAGATGGADPGAETQAPGATGAADGA